MHKQMSGKRPKFLSLDVWEPIGFWLIGLLILAVLLVFKLGSLLPGLSQPEVATHASAISFRAIINNPLNGQYKLLVYGLDHLGQTSAFALRAVSALFAAITVGLFYYIVSRWHDRRTAIIGTILFATSAWFLHYARLAIPDVSLTLVVAAVAYGYWIRQTKHSALVGLLGVLIAVWLIYIPGLIWFVILGGIWQSRQIVAHMKESKLSVPLIVIISVILLVPLGLAISRQTSLVKPLVGLPAGSLPSIYDIIRHILNVPFQILFHGPDNPVIWLGRLPLLDILAITMSLLGVYAYYDDRHLDRTKLIAASLIIGTVLIGLRGSVSMILLTPFIYLLVTAGVAYLLSQWLKVFPRNPLARFIGIFLIILTVAVSCTYNLRHYFIAWPGNPTTKQAFQQKIL